ncbi:3-dehydroquinate synthase [Ectobacillus antri]|jgi:3-dehydroquinate synthase|uniref:3-dehydroquinate synthase n=1 Tax=Ectobacillus antri TaxID=2486280 RepID=A0ABT6H098_9BACI|nr:3-dehydroquinate synthase [Ectobacillus antri]MDG4656100.1 3-dehydroquinate synthase [Ectobacillus antri]MDG5752775.1 3-dehydroquinate synthase [Ectobacillus antri]
MLYIETKSKRYPLYLGEEGLTALRSIYQQLQPKPSSVLVISDSVIAPLYMKQVTEALADADIHTYVIPSGEKEKSFENYYAVQTYALEKGMDRRSVIIALGGGVIGDLAGFVAATFMRGIRFIQMPTTLLAHDSAVGGKVAINHPIGKNMIGAFYQPEAVIYHIPFLYTLPEEEWRSGYAEVIKHGVIGDAHLYDWLQKEILSLEDLRGEKLQYALQRAIAVKAKIVAADETESGVRAYLNFGHTLGHAIEAELGYGRMTHGDAVAVGMRFAHLLSERIYGIELARKEFEKWLLGYRYPKLPPELNIERLLLRMKQDKKAELGVIRMVLLKGIADVCVEEVPDVVVLDTLAQFAQTEHL